MRTLLVGRWWARFDQFAGARDVRARRATAAIMQSSTEKRRQPARLKRACVQHGVWLGERHRVPAETGDVQRWITARARADARTRHGARFGCAPPSGGPPAGKAQGVL